MIPGLWRTQGYRGSDGRTDDWPDDEPDVFGFFGLEHEGSQTAHCEDAYDDERDNPDVVLCGTSSVLF